jgi:hypothetical protein
MLPQLKAERQLAAIEAADVAFMSGEGRAETREKYVRVLDGETKAKPATKANLAAARITVEYVNADGTPASHGTASDGTEGDT